MKLYILDNGRVFYDPSELTSDQINAAIQMNQCDFPIPKEIEGKIPVLKSNKLENRVWYDYYEITDLPKQKTEEELKIEQYKQLTMQYIHERYNYDDENEILREYLSNQINEKYREAFDAYNAYVLDCKIRAHTEIYSDTQ